MKQQFTQQSGFTLLETLLLIAGIAILACIVLFAINPGKQLESTRNAERQTEVAQIVTAVQQYSIANNGSVPSGITTTPTEICKTDASCAGLVDLSALVPLYITSIPTDPTGASTNGTGYEISKTAAGDITVTAPNAEQGRTINVTN